MSSKDNIDSESARQEETSQIQTIHNLVQALLQLIGPSAPAIMSGALYTSEQVEKNLSMSPNTLAAWREHNGLFGMKPGTSKYLYCGEDVIEFCRKHAAGNVLVPRTAQQKAKARKAKSK